MANVTNDLTTAQGWVKKIWGEVNDVRPSGIKLTDKIKFDQKKSLGQKYSEPVWLTHENGFTYSSGVNGTGFALNNSEAALAQELTLSGAEIALTSRVSLKQLSTAVSAGEKAFGNFYKRLLANMTASFKRRVEISTFYGGSSIATASAFSGSSTTRTVTISDATWAPGVFNGGLNSWVDCYNGSTLLNTLADVQVTTVTPASKQIIITGNATDMTAIAAASTSCEFYYKGSYGAEQVGLKSIAGNTSTTYANISPSTYDLWQGNPITLTSDLTWDAIQSGVEAAVGRGLEDNGTLYVPLKAWTNLNSDLNALRVIDSSYKKTENELGQEAIVYHTLSGAIRVEASIYVKGGDAFFIPDSNEYHARIGSTDMTMEIPGKGGEYFQVVPGYNSVEFRAYSDQALLIRAPSKCIGYSGIVSS